MKKKSFIITVAKLFMLASQCIMYERPRSRLKINSLYFVIFLVRNNSPIGLHLLESVFRIFIAL